jgi:hypothetical protein
MPLIAPEAFMAILPMLNVRLGTMVPVNVECGLEQ